MVQVRPTLKTSESINFVAHFLDITEMPEYIDDHVQDVPSFVFGIAAIVAAYAFLCVATNGIIWLCLKYWPQRQKECQGVLWSGLIFNITFGYLLLATLCVVAITQAGEYLPQNISTTTAHNRTGPYESQIE